jgi:solute carrier family 25 (mitochondrial carnitine/acylcarnitine transporter), member 20/29
VAVTNAFSGVSTIVASILPGAIGGFCNVCIGHPMDLIKVRQQMMMDVGGASILNHGLTTTTTSLPSQHSTLQMLRTIVQSNGFVGLYAGISAPLVAVVPAFAISFASYDYATNHLRQQQQLINFNGDDSLTLSQTALAGGFSGVPLALVVGPTERIKCLMQTNPNHVNYSTFGKAVSTVYRNGGISSLMRGTLLTVVRDVPGNAAYFATYEGCKRLFARMSNDYGGRSVPPISSTILAGGLAGVANWIVAIPFDVVKSRWQSSEPGRYPNVRAVIVHLLQTEGPKAFFRGLTPALLRAFPANAACFLGAETAKKALENATYRS